MPLPPRRRRFGHNRAPVNPGDGRVNEVNNTTLAVGAIIIRIPLPISLLPSFYAGFSLHRRARRDEVCESMLDFLFFPRSDSPHPIWHLLLTIKATLLEVCLLNGLHHRFEVAYALPDEFVVRGGRDEVKVTGEIGDPYEMS